MYKIKDKLNTELILKIDREDIGIFATGMYSLQQIQHFYVPLREIFELSKDELNDTYY